MIEALLGRAAPCDSRAWGGGVREGSPRQETADAKPTCRSARVGFALESGPVAGIAAIPSDRDIYANLLRDTRGLRRDQASARDGWFAQLPWDKKEDTLF